MLLLAFLLGMSGVALLQMWLTPTVIEYYFVFGGLVVSSAATTKKLVAISKDQHKSAS